MRLPRSNGLGRAFWPLTVSGTLAWVAGGVVYAQAAPGKPVDPRTVMLIGAVFFFSLTGASIAAIFATRRDGGRDLPGTES
jgi:uncharacterized protein involved in exopolysaccharide biosynthesis